VREVAYSLTVLTNSAGDDAGKLASAVGLVLDAQGVLGGPRLKRAVIVIDDGKVSHVAVEDAPPNG
jgi:peroxiredoxin